jgi:hypothetical protein
MPARNRMAPRNVCGNWMAGCTEERELVGEPLAIRVASEACGDGGWR